MGRQEKRRRNTRDYLGTSGTDVECQGKKVLNGQKVADEGTGTSAVKKTG